jgi:leader peptidase (prepilin peptidase) / N-methyltransferase
MLIAASIFLGVIGLMVGSFLNVIIDRLPARQSIVTPPSHCPTCKERLSITDLVPVFSFLFLRGRCRTCGARIGTRSVWVELVTAIAFGVLYWFLHTTPWLTAIAIIYFCFLLVIAVIDLEQGFILNRLVYPGIGLALVISLPVLLKLPSSPLSGSSLSVPSPFLAIGGAAFGFGLFLLIALISRGGMGWGDVKMAALMGAMLGFPRILVGIFLAIVMGGLVAIALVVTRIKGRKQSVPFGPFLALGTFLALFWGQTILHWYLHISGLE